MHASKGFSTAPGTVSNDAPRWAAIGSNIGKCDRPYLAAVLPKYSVSIGGGCKLRSIVPCEELSLDTCTPLVDCDDPDDDCLQCVPGTLKRRSTSKVKLQPHGLIKKTPESVCANCRLRCMAIVMGLLLMNSALPLKLCYWPN